MSFVKNNAHWLVLSSMAAASVAGTSLLLMEQLELPERHAKLRPQEIRYTKLPALDLSVHDHALTCLKSPGYWEITYPSDLFVSEPYLLGAEGPVRPSEGSLHRHSTLEHPIPNQWFLDHNLALRTPNVATDDTDGDGFTNEDEWWWRTDPNDPTIYPPLVTRLNFLPQKPAPNRIEFVSYEGNPEKPDSEPLLRINLIWVDAPDFRVSCTEAVLVDPAKPAQQSSYKFRLRRDDIPESSPVDVKPSDLVPGTGIKLISWTAGNDGKPNSVVLKNLDGDKNQTVTASVGGPSVQLARDQRQKKFRLRVGELIPGTQIKLLRFEPRREKIEGVSATKDKSVIYLKEEKTDSARELPAVYNGERGENIANFADQKIIFKQEPPKAIKPFPVKLAEPIELADGSALKIESIASESAVLVMASGPNQGKRWLVSETRSRLLDAEGKELNLRPEPPHWTPTPPPPAAK
jgi:hypothetical protein